MTKIEGAARLLMVNCLSGVLPFYVVTEYPKSGGSWVSQMLAEYLNVPFPRNVFPKLEPSILHGHYLYGPKMQNVFVVLRDGRDIMVSFYFHSYFKNELGNHRLVEIMKKRLPFGDYDDVTSNLPRFIEFTYTKKLFPRFTWSEFVDSWYDRNAAFIRYERLLVQPVDELGTAIRKYAQGDINAARLQEITQRYHFRNVSKREPGQADTRSFLRKGIAGDWKNHFTQDTRRIFNYYAGRELVLLGYENDTTWADRELTSENSD